MLLEPVASKVWFNCVVRQQHVYSPLMNQTHKDKTQLNKILVYSTVIIALIYICMYSPWEDTLDMFTFLDHGIKEASVKTQRRERLGAWAGRQAGRMCLICPLTAQSIGRGNPSAGQPSGPPQP